MHRSFALTSIDNAQEVTCLTRKKVFGRVDYQIALLNHQFYETNISFLRQPSITMKIWILFGHPVLESYGNALTEQYSKGAQDSGHEVQRINKAELDFDFCLRNGYAAEQALEPDIADAQEKIKWADHLVFIYPTWWGTPPAIVKSFIERTLLPGFAFKYTKKSKKYVTMDRFLTDKTGHVISTMDAPIWYYKWIVGDPGYKMMKDVFGCCGIKSLGRTYFGSVKMSDQETKHQWLEQCYQMGKDINR